MPQPLPSIDPRVPVAVRQLEDFRDAVSLLGGSRETARLLNVNETTVRDLVKGRKALHVGWLSDIARLLVALADRAAALEKRLTPLRSDNLTPEQAEEINHGRRDARRHREGRL